MECNKEEAVRAMQLSDIKMKRNDFTGARKMAEKAQRLFPDLENIEKLLTVCEVLCSSENKIGGLEMDWYGILQIQKFDNDATIKKQYRKLALLLHPDKNKFAGAEAAFKLIGEANRVLADQGKRSTYDSKCRALAKTGPSMQSADPPNGNLFVRKHEGSTRSFPNIPQSQVTGANQHQRVHPDTFWTNCPFCEVKYQYFKDFVNRLLRCQRCRRAFVAQDLGIPVQAAHSESIRNEFPIRKQPSSPASVASQSNGGTRHPSSTRFQNGNAASNPVSNVGLAADVSMASKTEKKDIGHGVEVRMEGVDMSKSGPVKFKDSGNSRNTHKKRGNSIFESGESYKTENRATADPQHVSKPSVLNGGDHHRTSSRKKQNISYNENVKGDDVRPLNMFTEKERKTGPVSGGECRNDTSPDESLPRKRSKTGEFEQKVKEAAMPDNDDSDFCSGLNSNVASEPKIVDVPDPEFNKFVLDEDMLKNIMSVNQTWALYDPLDGMPRFYARVKKICNPGFKLKIVWLEPDPDDEFGIAWCNNELPVACGKYRLGNYEDVTDALTISHQVHCTKGSGRSSYLVHPRKGETWALYQNWDVRWGFEPEKHVPNKFEYVEVLSDFVESKGIGVAYLGKVKGFISLFEQREQHGVVSFQVLPNELYRFSHRIPSCRMTGDEGDCVPKGSLELDPASLPPSLFEFMDLKMDSRTINTVTEPKPVTGCGRIYTPEEQEKNYSETETSVHKSPGKSNKEFGNSVKSEATAATACQTESINTPKKYQENNSDRGTSGLRRSPRDLHKNSTRANVSVKLPDSSNVESHASFTQSKINSTSCQSADSLHLRTKDCPPVHSMKSSVAPPSSSTACRLSETQFYDFDGLKSEEKFQVGQIWALYSEGNGMPKTYAQVKSIESKPDFQLHVALLDPWVETYEMLEPVFCGTFRVKIGPAQVFSRTKFSHCLNATPVGKKTFEIYPRKGEIWALHKNHKNEYEIVEVLEDNGQNTKVLVLAKHQGYKTVYKAPRIQRSRNGVIDIPRAEFHRFSHQIPAFQHTGETDSRLSGFWELDPFAIPGMTTFQK